MPLQCRESGPNHFKVGQSVLVCGLLRCTSINVATESMVTNTLLSKLIFYCFSSSGSVGYLM